MFYFEPLGAYHLAKKSGNFGLRSNGKAMDVTGQALTSIDSFGL